MSPRKLILSAIIASTFATLAPAALARGEVYINVPAPRAGFVWTPGYRDGITTRVTVIATVMACPINSTADRTIRASVDAQRRARLAYV